MVAAAEIQLGEEASPLELVQQLIDDRYGELVLHRLGVELTVVDAESLCLVLLMHKQHRSGEGGRAGPEMPWRNMSSHCFSISSLSSCG
jgi:hypothetical protein